MILIQPPVILSKSNYMGQELGYKWNDNIESKLDNGTNEKLLNILTKLNYKTVMGLGIAASEWGFWRLEGKRKSLKIIFLYTEAHWLGLFDKYYLLP